MPLEDVKKIISSPVRRMPELAKRYYSDDRKIMDDNEDIQIKKPEFAKVCKALQQTTSEHLEKETLALLKLTEDIIERGCSPDGLPSSNLAKIFPSLMTEFPKEQSLGIIHEVFAVISSMGSKEIPLAEIGKPLLEVTFESVVNRDYPVSLRREASESMNAFLTNSPENKSLFTSSPHYEDRLSALLDSLQSCGDVTIQSNIIEMLFRFERTGRRASEARKRLQSVFAVRFEVEKTALMAQKFTAIKSATFLDDSISFLRWFNDEVETGLFSLPCSEIILPTGSFTVSSVEINKDSITTTVLEGEDDILAAKDSKSTIANEGSGRSGNQYPFFLEIQFDNIRTLAISYRKSSIKIQSYEPIREFGQNYDPNNDTEYILLRFTKSRTCDIQSEDSPLLTIRSTDGTDVGVNKETLDDIGFKFGNVLHSRTSNVVGNEETQGGSEKVSVIAAPIYLGKQVVEEINGYDHDLIEESTTEQKANADTVKKGAKKEEESELQMEPETPDLSEHKAPISGTKSNEIVEKGNNSAETRRKGQSTVDSAPKVAQKKTSAKPERKTTPKVRQTKNHPIRKAKPSTTLKKDVLAFSDSDLNDSEKVNISDGDYKPPKKIEEKKPASVEKRKPSPKSKAVTQRKRKAPVEKGIGNKRSKRETEKKAGEHPKQHLTSLQDAERGSSEQNRTLRDFGDSFFSLLGNAQERRITGAKPVDFDDIEHEPLLLQTPDFKGLFDSSREETPPKQISKYSSVPKDHSVRSGDRIQEDVGSLEGEYKTLISSIQQVVGKKKKMQDNKLNEMLNASAGEMQRRLRENDKFVSESITAVKEDYERKISDLDVQQKDMLQNMKKSYINFQSDIASVVGFVKANREQLAKLRKEFSVSLNTAVKDYYSHMSELKKQYAKNMTSIKGEIGKMQNEHRIVQQRLSTLVSQAFE